MDKFDSHKLHSYSIRELLKNPHINGIIYKVFNQYKRSIDTDELNSLKMLTLWNCVKKYDPTKGTQFTSFLYQHLTFACKNELKKKRREHACEHIEQYTNKHDVKFCGHGQRAAVWGESSHYDHMLGGYSREMHDMIDGLPPEISKVLKQRFVYSMTMNEIGDANGYSRETARRRLINAIQVCRKRNCIQT